MVTIITIIVMIGIILGMYKSLAEPFIRERLYKVYSIEIERGKRLFRDGCEVIEKMSHAWMDDKEDYRYPVFDDIIIATDTGDNTYCTVAKVKHCVIEKSTNWLWLIREGKRKLIRPNGLNVPEHVLWYLIEYKLQGANLQINISSRVWQDMMWEKGVHSLFDAPVDAFKEATDMKITLLDCFRYNW